MDDLQLGPGRRILRRHDPRVPAGYPQELLDLHAHLAGLAVLFLLVRGPFAGDRLGARRLVRPDRADDRRHRVGRRRTRVLLLDLLAVLGQQLPVGHGHVVRPELVVGQRTVRAVQVRGRLDRGALGRGWRRRRLGGLTLDTPRTLGRTAAVAAGDRILRGKCDVSKKKFKTDNSQRSIGISYREHYSNSAQGGVHDSTKLRLYDRLYKLEIYNMYKYIKKCT